MLALHCPGAVITQVDAGHLVRGERLVVLLLIERRKRAYILQIRQDRAPGASRLMQVIGKRFFPLQSWWNWCLPWGDS